MIVILPHNNFQGYGILVSAMDNKRNYNSAKKTALFITVIAPKLMDPKLVPIYASEYMWLLFHIYFLLLVKN